MKRSGPLRRGKPLKRTAMKRRPSKVRTTVAMKRAKEDFRRAARDQRCCAVCGYSGPWDAHHVVERQYLRINSLPQYVAPNALRVCATCHRKHTVRIRPIPLSKLTLVSIGYAVALLGPERGEDYLRKHYAGTDPRLDRALEAAHGRR